MEICDLNPVNITAAPPISLNPILQVWLNTPRPLPTAGTGCGQPRPLLTADTAGTGCGQPRPLPTADTAGTGYEQLRPLEIADTAGTGCGQPRPQIGRAHV